MPLPRVHALILAAGASPRLLAADDPSRGFLAPLGGRTPLEIWATRLRELGVSKVRLVTADPPGRLAELAAQLSNSTRIEVEPGHPGAGSTASTALASNRDLAEEAQAVLVLHAGFLSDLDLVGFVRSHRERGVDRIGLPDSSAAVYTGEAFRIADQGQGFDLPARFILTPDCHVDVTTEKGRLAVKDRAGQILTRLLRPVRSNGRPAAFLDRDGTINFDVHYLSDPAKFRLIPGAGRAIRRLNEAGIPCVVVTNQSGIGRGMFTEEQLGLVHEAMASSLTEEGAYIDAIYYCKEAPAKRDTPEPPGFIEHLDRKPGPGMLYRAAADLNLNLDASWMVGDKKVDALAGYHAGCRESLIVRTGKAVVPESLTTPHRVVDDLAGAVDCILGTDRDPEPAHAHSGTTP